MAVNTARLIAKMNFVLSSRQLKEKDYIEEYSPIPTTDAEEEQVIQQMVFMFIKKLFPGCKIRTNSHSYSIRLDSHIHRKANKLRNVYETDSDFRQWFENAHSRLHRIMRDNRQSFASGQMITRRVDGEKVFLSIPNTPNRIHGYSNYGLAEFCKWVEAEYKRDVNLSEIYEESMSLMQAETERKEREKRERLEREIRSYMEQITRELFKPVAHLQESDNAVDRLFASKFSEWARENHKAPEYALEPTVSRMVPRDLKVKVMAPAGAEEEGWVSLPPFEGYAELVGYETQGRGKVTSIDTTSERSRNGQSPIVVQEYLYTEFHLEHWAHLLPAEFAEIFEVTQRLRAEAQAEIEPWLEQERIRAEQERHEALRVQEQERLAREDAIRLEAQERERREAEEAARLQRLRESLSQQMQTDTVTPGVAIADVVVTETAPVYYDPSDTVAPDTDSQGVPYAYDEPEATPSNPALLEALRSQMASAQAAPAQATDEGIYRNSMAIPLERYVAVAAGGTIRRFATISRAISWMGYEDVQSTIEIRDFHAPHDVVDYHDNF